MKPTKKQARQRELSWSLYICLGFRASIHLIPKGVAKAMMQRALDDLIHELYVEIRSL